VSPAVGAHSDIVVEPGRVIWLIGCQEGVDLAWHFFPVRVLP
jgi:hypothetical protein